MHPSDPNRLWTAGDGGKLFKSTDGGQLWTRSDEGLEGLSVAALAETQVGGRLRLLATVRRIGADLDGSGGVYLSDDEGESWVPSLRTDLLGAVAVDPSAPNRVVASGGRGVWRSEDSGTTWDRVNHSDVHLQALEFDRTSDGAVLFAGGTKFNCDFAPLAAGGSDPSSFYAGRMEEHQRRRDMVASARGSRSRYPGGLLRDLCRAQRLDSVRVERFQRHLAH